jgi:predicted ATP-grasp superfamily ATP-dependent carboligase
MLAEAAALDGFDIVALDLFGDADTRRAATRWQAIGKSGSVQLDGVRVLDALRELAQDAAAIGWIPGSGFEGRPDLLEAGARLLPLIGTPADAVRRVRDPSVFFGVLAAHGIAHPQVRGDAPADTEGWLLKDARACGGWHIRHAHAGVAPSASHYFQRAMPGLPMSATFIANGRESLLLGINELIVRPFGAHPHVYCGCVGPVLVADDVLRRVGDAIRLLSAEFTLRGWCSLDFILDGDSIGVLELNPRPPASLALYAQRGLIDAQLRACLHAELPSAAAFTPAQVAGNEIVYARRPLRVDDACARRLADHPNLHDLPMAGARFAVGDPICSLSANAHDAAQVKALLSAGRDALLHTLETPP